MCPESGDAAAGGFGGAGGYGGYGGGAGFGNKSCYVSSSTFIQNMLLLNKRALDLRWCWPHFQGVPLWCFSRFRWWLRWPPKVLRECFFFPSRAEDESDFSP